MKLSIGDKDFLDSFVHLWEKDVDEYKSSKLNLFMLNINANSFDYPTLIENLRDPLVNYSVSRKTRELYNEKPAKLVHIAQEKFKNYINNNGELGELLLYCFLETHLDAPKILSKLELKTSTEMYVHGADGIHMYKVDDNNYQLIFGESKTVNNLRDSLYQAFKSIKEFKDESSKGGKSKSGISYEKTLLNSNIDRETFTEEERDLLRKIIYPSKTRHFDVDDAFGIFIGYEIEITNEDRKLSNKDFREKIKNIIDKDVSDRIKYINDKIAEHDLYGHSFYFYVLPFTDLDTSRKKILEEIT
ncbi:DUF1837 domain-containing protein [Clostridium sp. 'deep sea']|uniref:HamA C-terminal domain-containing protein n=1 Tax=Clostridium sp. 'deep sea' TaxID=2779445 RepID=UPI0018969B84|nr:DUF1837 domain-containing protein [Clostridium sp. 'deep sea']QOR34750.1 DUF1837 domain-containing protein [Clostridium sp. 'deep sea']